MTDTVEGTDARRLPDSNLGVDPSAVGTRFNFKRRRFVAPIGTISMPAFSAGQNHVIGDSFILREMPEIREFIRYAPTAHIITASYKVIPQLPANALHTLLFTASFPEGDAGPSDEAAFNEIPSTQVSMIVPSFPGGAVPIPEFEVSFNYGTQRQIKPLPLIGGTPVIAFSFSSSLLNQNATHAASIPYIIFADVTVEIR